MLEIRLSITGLECLAQSIEKLAAVRAAQAGVPQQTQTMQPQQAQTAQAGVPQQTAEVPQQVQTIQPQQTAGVPQQAQTVQPQQTVQTTQATYTLDDLARAAMALMDAGRQPELQQLLGKFGVESLPQLPKEHYGAFATELRGMGAQI